MPPSSRPRRALLVHSPTDMLCWDDLKAISAPALSSVTYQTASDTVNVSKNVAPQKSSKEKTPQSRGSRKPHYKPHAVVSGKPPAP
eukprot:scaffold185881_cov13-Tisochrysis_lutea.AAC.1